MAGFLEDALEGSYQLHLSTPCGIKQCALYIEDIHFMNAVPLKTHGYVLRTINQTEGKVSKNFFSPPSLKPSQCGDHFRK